MYDNLKKTILFVMPTNLAQGLLIVIALLAGQRTAAHAGVDPVDEHGHLRHAVVWPGV
ncbi:cation-transporting P-type ATPase [Klebsiella pneumoniae]|uniref:Cation-transporting P-type ATPase n=1 Tax=Klebsiella pneumoniae TaxID=573 RepID=A0A377XR05_KLEPN|nr:cation-transporting P-type ATPase [Klebsiella pneumoniae]